MKPSASQSQGTSVMETPSARHRVIPETHGEMLKADLRKPETVNFQAEIGRCLFLARASLGWTLEQLAAALPPPPDSTRRDPRQVRRWEAGEERTQVDVVFSVEALREPFALQLAKLSGAVVSVNVDFRKVV